LTRDGRREQLLDVAAELIVERGITAATMEGVAERAGVSKALPYAHFDNADALISALHRREIDAVGAAVASAMRADAAPEERMRAAIHAYFDIVEERSRVLSLLMTPGSSSEREADDLSRIGHRFVAGLLEETFGVTGARGRALAAIMLGALWGALDAWAHGEAGRRTIEETLVGMLLHGIAGSGGRPGTGERV
jgi:AcrR family transcriptional regulator